MSDFAEGPSVDLRGDVLKILADNPIMSVATLRPDGWPQATLVGYVSDGLVLYFLIARDSQKLRNIRREPRISIAVGHLSDDRLQLHGLSMAAIAVEITDSHEIERLNDLTVAHYREQPVFAPRGASVAIIRVAPKLISLIDARNAHDQAALLDVVEDPLSGELSLVRRLRDGLEC